MTDSTNDRIRQLEAALAECEQERDDAINQKQYASGFMGVEAIERDALRFELSVLEAKVKQAKLAADVVRADIRGAVTTLRLVMQEFKNNDDVGYTLGYIISTLERIANDG